MFIRTKGKHHCLVENRRADGKVRQKVLMYLGDAKTIEEAIKQRRTWAARRREWVKEVRGIVVQTARPTSVMEVMALHWKARAEGVTLISPQQWLHEWQSGPRLSTGYYDDVARTRIQKKFRTLERFAQWKLAAWKRKTIAKYFRQAHQFDREVKKLERLLKLRNRSVVAI
jgi:hypothetical protein